jgi:hypothetical protein
MRRVTLVAIILLLSLGISSVSFAQPSGGPSGSSPTQVTQAAEIPVPTAGAGALLALLFGVGSAGVASLKRSRSAK